MTVRQGHIALQHRLNCWGAPGGRFLPAMCWAGFGLVSAVYLTVSETGLFLGLVASMLVLGTVMLLLSGTCWSTAGQAALLSAPLF